MAVGYGNGCLLCQDGFQNFSFPQHIFQFFTYSASL